MGLLQRDTYNWIGTQVVPVSADGDESFNGDDAARDPLRSIMGDPLKTVVSYESDTTNLNKRASGTVVIRRSAS